MTLVMCFFLVRARGFLPFSCIFSKLKPTLEPFGVIFQPDMPHHTPSAEQLYAVVYYLIFGWRELPDRLKRRILLRLVQPIQGYQQHINQYQKNIGTVSPACVQEAQDNIKTFYRDYLIKIMQSISNARLYERSFHEFSCEMDFIARRETEKVEKLMDDFEKMTV